MPKTYFSPTPQKFHVLHFVLRNFLTSLRQCNSKTIISHIGNVRILCVFCMMWYLFLGSAGLMGFSFLNLSCWNFVLWWWTPCPPSVCTSFVLIIISIFLSTKKNEVWHMKHRYSHGTHMLCSTCVCPQYLSLVVPPNIFVHSKYTYFCLFVFPILLYLCRIAYI